MIQPQDLFSKKFIFPSRVKQFGGTFYFYIPKEFVEILGLGDKNVRVQVGIAPLGRNAFAIYHAKLKKYGSTYYCLIPRNEAKNLNLKPKDVIVVAMEVEPHGF